MDLGLAGLVDLVAGQVRVGFGEFRELIHDTRIGIGYTERASAVADIRLDTVDAIDRLQSSSDRGGTAASRHVRHFETDESARSGFRLGTGIVPAAATDQGQQGEYRQHSHVSHGS